jgi:uncharacterized membrane protein YvlD (DUF360 family)
VAGKKGEIQYPSSPVVKYLNITAAVLGIISVVIDALVPIAQQVGKKREAREGLERAINMTILLTVIRTVPRLVGQVRKLQAQLATEVVE